MESTMTDTEQLRIVVPAGTRKRIEAISTMGDTATEWAAGAVMTHLYIVEDAFKRTDNEKK